MSLVTENKENLPILIVDRIGFLGEEIAKSFSDGPTVVFVSQKNVPFSDNLIHVPFKRKIPKIPDNVYSHIFVFDDGEDITIDFLSSFLNKAYEDKAVFCFVTGIKNQDRIPSELLVYKRTRLVFLGDIFPATSIFPKSYINSFLIQSKNRGRIDVPEDGMGIAYPVYLEDALKGILEASFSISSEKIYYLFPKYGVTLLSLAHMVQKNDPSIRIDFSREDSPQNISINKEGKYLLGEKYPLEERIRNLKIHAGNLEKSEEPQIKKRAWEKRNFSLDYKLFLYAFIFFLFLPLLSTLLFSFLAFFSLSKINDSAAFFGFSKTSFFLAKTFSKTLSYELGFVNIGFINQFTDTIDRGTQQIEGLAEYFNAKDSLSNGRINEGIIFLKNFLVFSESQKGINVIDSSFSDFISQTINVWPQALAVSSKKNYLILHQDSSSPRPTGGLIKTFGILTLEDGKITNLRFYNTSDSDKNLKGHVEPPFAIRRYLGSQHFFLRDSNFNPSFKDSAASAVFFVNLEEGQKVDGVIALDSDFLKKIISSDSVEGLKNLKSKDLVNFFFSKDFSRLLQRKDIIFESEDSGTENVLESGNYKSSISDLRINSPKVINDFQGIIESDFGQDISGVERKINSKINVADNGEISSSLAINYKNSGGTDYKNYLRFILPQGAVLKNIRINNQDTEFTNAITDPAVYESSDFTPPQKLEIEKYDQDNKSIYGFLVLIPKNNSKNIEIDYSLGNLPSISSVSNFTYNLMYFKQPGIDPYQFNFSILYPNTFKTPSSSFSKMVDKDFDLNLDFSQK